MSGWTFTLKQVPALRVDMRSVSPAAFATLDARAVAAHRVHHGNEALALGDLFTIAPCGEEGLRFEGDLSRFDRLGWQLAVGTLHAEGSVGDYFGAGMSGGKAFAAGHAGLLAACEMSGGHLEVGGNVGDHAASALPGSMDGMRGGTLIVRGAAGARLGDRMRRGTVLVFGDVGDFAASRMVAGTLAVAGRFGAHPAYGMRRGTVLALGPRPVVPSTFVPNGADITVFWQLLARALASHGGAFATLGRRRPLRHLGDLAAGGKGELLLAT